MEQIRTSRSLGAALRGERTKQGRSQQSVAARAHVSRETIVALEQGRGGNLGTLFAVLKALNLTLATTELRPAAHTLDALLAESSEL